VDVSKKIGSLPKYLAMSIKTISCKQATSFIAQQEEQGLTIKQRLQLWRHLAGCSLCRLFSKQNKWMNQWLGSPVQPDSQLAGNEKQAIVDAMQASGPADEIKIEL
jgi:hypothetical protein